MRRVLLYGCASVAFGLLVMLALLSAVPLSAAALTGLLLAALSFASLILNAVDE